jgi:hypothetical protein
MIKRRSMQSGFILPTVLSFIIAGLIFAGAVSMVIYNNFFVIGTNVKSQEAFNIAEAGINYYLWHMSHNGGDYRDGNTTPATPDPTLGYGPYVHDYYDANAVKRGSYTLWIKPQGTGSTIVEVRAIGKIKNSNITRTVQAQIGATSFASYAVVSDSALWFGADETADGPVHSNVGVRMDGASNSTVSSANATYVPSTQLGGDGSSHPGVWCSPSVTSPVNCNTRDKSNWIYPATAVDFNQVSSALCTIKKQAFAADSSTASLADLSNACSKLPTSRTSAYIPQRSASANASHGYMIELNPNNTYNLYTVNNEDDSKTTWQTALVESLVASNIPVPSTNVVFVEDNTWVRTNPNYKGRVTIAAGRMATSVTANIKIVGNLAYSAKDGSDAIGLVSEGSVLIAPYAPPATGNFTLEIDAAMLAETGSVLFPSNYDFANNRCTRGYVGADQKLNFYGSVATRQIWTWSWQSNSGCGDMVYDASSGKYISGFLHNTTSYDYNLLYAPPPSYPVTGGYGIIQWREVLTKP